MKHLTEELWFDVPTRRAFINITPQVTELVQQSGVQEGLCLVNVHEAQTLLHPALLDLSLIHI